MIMAPVSTQRLQVVPMTIEDAQLFGRLEGLTMAAILVGNTPFIEEMHAASIACALEEVGANLLRRHIASQFPIPAGETHNEIELRAS